MISSRRALVAVPAAVLLLSACGDGADAPAGDAPPSSPATAGSTTIAPEGESGSGQMADLEFEDQSGPGDRVVVARVTAPGGGFVVVSGGGDDAVLGSTLVQVGTTSDVAVDLDPALTGDTDLTATLYADTDADGEFDQAVDEPVPAPEDAREPAGEQDEVVADEATYSVG
ncbi:DUF7282 domain-containing protein [Modestobacter sp. SYSU DS0657]